MMREIFQPAVILAQRESSVVVRAQHKNDASRWSTYWIPAVARMTAVGGMTAVSGMAAVGDGGAQ
jgi:hypothetical protein